MNAIPTPSSRLQNVRDENVKIWEARYALNDKLHLTERLIALVRKTTHLQVPDEQTELLDHLEEQRGALRTGLAELFMARHSRDTERY